MKILHINCSDKNGGAARAAYRLHRALLQKGVESKMLVLRKTDDDPTVIALPKHKRVVLELFNIIEKIILKLSKPNHNFYQSINIFPTKLCKIINRYDVDIVNLHWINGAMLSISDLKKIEKKVVWTMHDLWPISGINHYDIQSLIKKNDTAKRGKKTLYNFYLDRFIAKKKELIFRSKAIYYVPSSQWVDSQIQRSKIVHLPKTSTIPIAINQEKYFPIGKREARALLKIDIEKKVILFGAISATDDVRKGFHYLTKALTKLADQKYLQENAQIFIFGASEKANSQKFKIETRYLGRFYDDLSLSIVYSAADVMVVPSLQESFGQTASEAMACGTPVVAFNATGLKDIVDHKVNGYLAKPFDVEDLAKGIEWVLNNPKGLSEMAIKKVTEKFSSHVVASQYIQLYKKILKQTNSESSCSDREQSFK